MRHLSLRLKLNIIALCLVFRRVKGCTRVFIPARMATDAITVSADEKTCASSPEPSIDSNGGETGRVGDEGRKREASPP